MAKKLRWNFTIYFVAPDAAPVNVTGHYKNSTAINVSWGLIQNEKRNGIITGYAVLYRKKSSSEDWKREGLGPLTRILLVGNLLFYTIYEFKVAGKTSGGEGPFSNPVDIRTDADGK